jgi:hypothetical protein
MPHLEAEDFRIDIDIAMHTIGLDQRVHCRGIVRVSRHGISLLFISI